MNENMNIFLVFIAGVLSVMSPCVLPVIPILVTGGSNEHKSRPFLLVAGLSVTFVLMGILSSLFGAVIGPKMFYVEKFAGILVALFGVLMMFNINIFKKLSFLSGLAQNSRGRFGGFFLGFILGIIWIPCIGPILSSVLAMVATGKSVLSGISLLLVYSLGFSVPMLTAAYASQFFRTRIKSLGKFPVLINIISGIILLAMGLFITLRGVFAFNNIFS